MKVIWENGQVHYEPDEEELGTDLPDNPKGKTLQELRKLGLSGSGPILAAAAKPAPFIWGPAVVRGTVNIFGGGPGAGKSTLLFYLLCGRARLRSAGPLDLLGFPLEAAPTGTFQVLIEEGPEGSTARKLVKSARHLGLMPEIFDRIILLARSDTTIGNHPNWKKVETLISEGLVSDIFLDTLASVSPLDPKNPGESNSEALQVKLFKILSKAIEKAPLPALQPTIWIAAHNRKGGGREIDDISGSIQRAAQCDTVALLEPKFEKSGKVGSVTLKFRKLREEPDEYPEPIRFSAGPNGIKILPKENPKTAAIEEPKFKSQAERILEALSKPSPSPNVKDWSWTALHKALPEISGDALTRLLKAHEAAGNVTRHPQTNCYMLSPGKKLPGRPENGSGAPS